MPPPPLNPDLLGLLASCRAAPADDTPRLVLADWLEEHADVSGLPSAADARARAALLRVQVELARPSYDEERVAALRAEEQKLLLEHAAGWLGPLPYRLHELVNPVFGFAQHVIGSRSPRPFVFEPLNPSNFWRFVRGLLHIDLRAESLTDPELGAWFASPLGVWTETADIDLGSPNELEQLTVPARLRPYLGTKLVVGATEFPTLLRPRARSRGTDEKRCRRLLKSTNFRLVRDLTLFSSALEAGLLRFLSKAQSLNFRRLTIKAPLSDAEAALLAAAPLTSLSALDVSGTQLTGDGLRQIANSPHLKQLVSLVAYRNEFGFDGLAALAASPMANTLNALEIQNTGTGDLGVAAVARSPLLSRLYGPGLNLSMNPIADEGVKALAACEHLSRFRELVLRDCAVGDVGVQALAASPGLANLTVLDLWKNRIGDVGARALASSPHLAGLRVLSLRDNDISPDGESALRARFGGRVRV